MAAEMRGGESESESESASESESESGAGAAGSFEVCAAIAYTFCGVAMNGS